MRLQRYGLILQNICRLQPHLNLILRLEILLKLDLNFFKKQPLLFLLQEYAQDYKQIYALLQYLISLFLPHPSRIVSSHLLLQENSKLRRQHTSLVFRRSLSRTLGLKQFKFMLTSLVGPHSLFPRHTGRIYL